MAEDNTIDTPVLGRDARGQIVTAPIAHLPAVIPPVTPKRQRRRSLRRGLLLGMLLLGATAAGYWWLHLWPVPPPGFAVGNGRLEADEIDIDTKFAGRIAQLFVDEGDMVKPAQVLAIMDTQDLQASLKKSEESVRQAQRSLDEANANLVQQQTQVTLAKQELDRTSALVPKGFAPVELLDQRRQQMNAAVAALNATSARVGQVEHALAAATHDVELYQVNIADNRLVAPREGRIQYRVANVGEVLAAGGKVFTMLDTGYVYIDVYLPTAEAGRVAVAQQVWELDNPSLLDRLFVACGF
jgi:HlyD family secretion protein